MYDFHFSFLFHFRCVLGQPGGSNVHFLDKFFGDISRGISEEIKFRPLRNVEAEMIFFTFPYRETDILYFAQP